MRCPLSTSRLQVNSKSEFLDGYLKLRFGNRLNQWTAEEFMKLYVAGQIRHKTMGIRRKDGVGEKKTALFTPHQIYMMFEDQPEFRSQFFVDDGAPNQYQTILGEIQQTPEGLHVFYGEGGWHMRKLWQANAVAKRAPGYVSTARAPQQPHVKHCTGLAATMLLKGAMCACSWDCLNELLATYDDPIIEFACFDRSVGVLDWNTIFWEVRTGY